jgi:hypothetical protein
LGQFGGDKRASAQGENERKYLGLFSVAVLFVTRKVDENWPPEWSNFCPPPTGRTGHFPRAPSTVGRHVLLRLVFCDLEFLDLFRISIFGFRILALHLFVAAIRIISYP